MNMDKPLKSWDTRVPISKSQEDLRNLLARFGATKIAFEEDLQKGTQILRFEYPLEKEMSVPVIEAIGKTVLRSVVGLNEQAL